MELILALKLLYWMGQVFLVGIQIYKALGF